jgi:hypothetical protein
MDPAAEGLRLSGMGEAQFGAINRSFHDGDYIIRP